MERQMVETEPVERIYTDDEGNPAPPPDDAAPGNDTPGNDEGDPED